MDILAARKKAAERAKEVKKEAVAPGYAPEESRTTVAPALPAGGKQEEPKVAVEQPPAPVAEVPVMLPPASPSPAPEQGAAPETADSAEGERELEMLAVLLGTEEYALPVDTVNEVLSPREITPVPHVPPHVLGVCSLRGIVLPVVDLHRRLGLAEGAHDEKSRIVVIRLGRDELVGLWVDRVRGVVRFPLSAVKPLPEAVAQGPGAELLTSIARKDDRLFILLDAEKAMGT
ncbi:MAG: chemotaxis protein CheW [Nitrospiraceae bacterium]|nr:chemotaxis protein CheW [Nitrospiraceae bacterium]